MREKTIRVGVDVGGTNTDICAINEENGHLMVYKLPSSVHDQSFAVIQGFQTLANQESFSGKDVNRFIHGTTVATNAILEGRGAETVLLTTKGFRDLLEIGRQKRPDLYDLQADKVRVLVSRNSRYEVNERMDCTGSVVRKLDCEELDRAITEIKAKSPEAIAVMLVNAYINSCNEEVVRDKLLQSIPDAFITISSDLSNQFREYERLCGTVLNSFVGPEVKKYMNILRDTLVGINIENTYINHSNGGLMSIEEAMIFPIKTSLSGPAAGVVGAQYLCELIGEHNLLTLDVGGTSTDISLVVDGRFEASDEKTISGYPVRIPSIDISTIGAGGGSIAWVDNGGILKVGPQSAGADPGPACYALGGDKATITDARVMIGHLNNKELLSGRLPIDATRSVKVISKLAQEINMDVLETARGIISVSNSNISKEIRNVTVAKGHNPSDFSLVAFGGSGPLHAAELLNEMLFEKVIVPYTPGLLAAYGLLTENLRRDFIQTYVIDLAEDTLFEVINQFGKLESNARDWYKQESIPTRKQRSEYFLDMRYKGQNHEIRVPITAEKLHSIEEIHNEFSDAYKRLYSFCSDDRVQIVNFGLSAMGDITKPAVAEAEYSGEDAANAIIGQRDVYDSSDKIQQYVLYSRDRLKNGNVIGGPAIVEQMDSTTVIMAGQTGRVDRYLNIIISRNESSEVTE